MLKSEVFGPWAKIAVKESLPAGSRLEFAEEVTQFATPEVVAIAPHPVIVVPPTWKFTVPDATAEGVTVAVSVTLVP